MQTNGTWLKVPFGFQLGKVFFFLFLFLFSCSCSCWGCMSVLLREGLCSKFSMDLPLAFLVQLIYLCLQTIKLPLFQSLSIPPSLSPCISLYVSLISCSICFVQSTISPRVRPKSSQEEGEKILEKYKHEQTGLGWVHSFVRLYQCDKKVFQ